MISIIIPAYNAEKTIIQTLDSVYNQTYKHLEIIVVNDGSTDSTIDLLRNYSKPLEIISIANSGVSKARSIGFLKSKGEYIQYLDSDDLLLPNKLSVQLEGLIQNNSDIAYGDWQKIKLNDKKITIQESICRKIENDIEIALFTDFWCPPAALLYSRRICNKLSWRENLPIIQDARYLLDAVITGGKIIYTPGIMAQYLIEQKDSLSQNSESQFVADCLTNAIEIYRTWENQFVKNPAKKQAVINVLRYCINRLSVLNKNLAIKAINFLLEIEPNYLPTESGILRTLSKNIGYKNAEMLAGYKRLFCK